MFSFSRSPEIDQSNFTSKLGSIFPKVYWRCLMSCVIFPPDPSPRHFFSLEIRQARNLSTHSWVALIKKSEWLVNCRFLIQVGRPGSYFLSSAKTVQGKKGHYSSGGLINHFNFFSASNEEFDTNTNACKLENDAIFCTKNTRVIFILCN